MLLKKKWLAYVLGLSLLCVLNFSELRGQNGFIPYVSLSAGLSYTGVNTYLNVGGNFRRHSIYIGPKIVASQSFFTGKTLWGVNAGYAYRLLEQHNWTMQVNLDYQNAIYQSPSTTNYIHEIAGAFCLNFFPHSPRFSIFANMGANIYIENYYDSYSASRASNSGLAPSVKIGLAYNLRK